MKKILCIITLMFLFGCTGDLSGEAPSALKFCGDGKCHPSELETCPQDCGGPMCGDGVVDISEECDPPGSTSDCTTEGYDTGTMTCRSDCSYDISACESSGPYCGDGTCNEGEDCTTCDVDCDSRTDSFCGDNVCNIGEDCESCPIDCAYGSINDCSTCQKGVCDGKCNPQDGAGCPDCGAKNYCCGSETCNTALCGADCGTEGNIIECCGDSMCEGAESYLSCETDCLLEGPCTETDNGFDLYTKGTTTGYAMSAIYKDQEYSATDSCLSHISPSAIYERYCANVDDLIASYNNLGLDTEILDYYKNRGVTELVTWKQDECPGLCVDGACTTASCQTGENKSCNTSTGCQGAATCVSGTWGPCIAIQNFCDTDCDGTNECTYQQCPACACISGETQSCIIGTTTGTATCNNGMWGPCEATCTDTCSSLGYECGTHTICGTEINCGTCQPYATCTSGGTCMLATCTDTDGGINTAVAGTVTNGITTYEDTCYNFGVNEGYCLNNTPVTKWISCGPNEYCLSGSCRPEIGGP